MKYKIENTVIPQDRRGDINEKCLRVIDSGMNCGITPADIASCYTGMGGLHGLKRSDYDNYSQYGRAKREIDMSQHFTPYSLAEWIVDAIRPRETDLVADLTCGHGVFFNYMPVERNIYGNELDLKAFKVAKYLYPEANLINEDIRFYNPGVFMDIIVGNPPYSLRIGDMDSVAYYCKKAAELLKPAGLLVVIAPKSYMADEFSNRSEIEMMNKNFNFITQLLLKPYAFAATGVDNFETKIMFFQRRSEHLPEIPYRLDDYCLEPDSEDVYQKLIRPVMEQKDKIKQKLYLEQMAKHDNAFQSQVTKLLFDIGQHPRTKPQLAECMEYVTQFNTQKRPDGVRADDWEEMMIKPEDVIKHLKDVLASQNPKAKKPDKRLVYTQYAIKEINGASVTEQPVYRLVKDDTYPFIDQTYRKLIEKKRRKYEVQEQKFADMEPDEKIAQFIRDTVLISKETGERIVLNDKQLSDLSCILIKDHGLLQWEQGSGKTLSSVFAGLYRMKVCNVSNTFVLSSAISIRNTWCDVLEDFGLDYILLETISDITKIRPGQFVLITTDMLCKLKRHVRKYVKMKSKKLFLIFDESDLITYPYSSRTKAALYCFRRLKYKLLMTGTSTRNNICEVCPQLELLYNNSVNMLSDCYYVYVPSKIKGETGYDEELNEYYGHPIPAYRRGYELFSRSHLPEKITVFGVGKLTQDIYNADVLKTMMDKTAITRTFEEVTGRKLFKPVPVTCRFNAAERELYRVAIKEFYKMENMFKSTGNSRKDAMMRILNQLLTLLKICAAPQTIEQYDISKTPSKFKLMKEKLTEFAEERVAIGVRHIEVVEAYAQAIREWFPDRPLFIITGDSVPLKQRKDTVRMLKKTTNGILLSTQQSLSASMNIDCVERVIIPELHWNNAAMSQYYCRFIRYTSLTEKPVYFLVYESSIEMNLFKMVLMKEKLNLFMKNQDLDEDEVYERFGIDDPRILQNLMYKEKTKDGVEIRWGEQDITSVATPTQIAFDDLMAG